MSMAGIRFGGIDPGFFGIRVSFSSDDDMQFFRDVYSKKLSPSQLKLQRASRELPEYRLWLATVVEHEYRHFHDCLISAHWLSMLNLRHQNMMNTAGLLPRGRALVSQAHGNCLPIPLRKWLRLSPEEREKRVQCWSTTEEDLAAEWRPIPMPVLPAIEVRLDSIDPCSPYWPRFSKPVDFRIVDGGVLRHAAAIMGYDRIDELMAGRLSGGRYSIRVRDVYELSALLVQLQTAHSTFDDRAADDLRHSMQRHAMSEYGNIVVLVLMVLLATRTIAEEHVFRVASALAIWALLGPPDLLKDRQQKARTIADRNLSCPAYRLEFALRTVEDFRITSLSTSDILAWLDKKSGGLTWQESSDWTSSVMTGRLLQMQELAKSSIGRAQGAALVLGVLRLLVSRRRQLMERFVTNCNDYVSPKQYIDVIEDWGQPVVRLELDNGLSSITEVVYAHIPDDVDLGLLLKYERLQLACDYVNTGRARLNEVKSVRSMVEHFLGAKLFVV